MRKKIVIDLDDTISVCHDRNWPEAMPVIPVIRKINKLFNMGWEIEIFSSRGSLSGIAYYEQVEKWLEDNGVLYSSLRFDKPLATYYVDDKAMTPTGFVNMNVDEFTSWSGRKLMRINNRLHKYDDNIQDTVNWYWKYDKLFYVPKVHSVIGKELILEWIEPTRKSTFEDAMMVVDQFSRLSEDTNIEPTTLYTWPHYIRRIEDHVKLVYEEDLSMILQLLVENPRPVNTIAHGDLTPDNIVVKKEKFYLIDPLQVTYSSVELDRAKVIAWGITHEPEHLNNETATWTYKGILVNRFVISELIRTIKYCTLSTRTKLIKLCLNYLVNIEKKESV